jgi:O-antigen biosynthesis protein
VEVRVEMSVRENRNPRGYVAAKEEASQDEDARVLMNPLDHPICLTMPKRLTPYSFWHEHIPFAMFLVDILRPGIVVELGTQYGDSYCAFCQAVKELRLDTRCYAVDTWQGDLHVGAYGPAVLADLRGHHDPLYGSFSSLIASPFEEVLPHFADGTIDILHIDGYHTYEAVKGDFESWQRKVSSRGVILLHDTNVRRGDFGVRRFWDEIQSKYAHFEFLHGSGLGIVAMQQASCKELRAFLDASDERTETIRDFFFQLGHRLAMEVKAAVLECELRQHEGHMHRIMNSRSWKLTAPLRALSSTLRSIRERAKPRSDGTTRPPRPLE